jgi:16S rRNA U516 pseudouridylate synthase RsuA-like enzyme
VVPKAQRREVWSGWLAEGRYRSLRELAEAVGFSAGFVSRVLRGER